MAVLMSVIFTPAIRLYLKDRWTRVTLIISLFLCLVAVVLIISLLPREDNIILHYNIYFGIDLIGDWREIFYIPMSVVAMIVINGFVGLFIWRRNRTISYLLNIGNVFLSLLAVISCSLIIYLNY